MQRKIRRILAKHGFVQTGYDAAEKRDANGNYIEIYEDLEGVRLVYHAMAQSRWGAITNDEMIAMTFATWEDLFAAMGSGYGVVRDSISDPVRLLADYEFFETPTPEGAVYVRVFEGTSGFVGVIRAGGSPFAPLASSAQPVSVMLSAHSRSNNPDRPLLMLDFTDVRSFIDVTDRYM